MTEDNNSAVELEPCPFCGDDEELRVEQDYRYSGYWWAICGSCSARIGAESEKGAHDWWNTRTLAKSAQPTEAMVSAAYDAGYNRAVEHANSRGWRSADKERDLAALHSIGEA